MDKIQRVRDMGYSLLDSKQNLDTAMEQLHKMRNDMKDYINKILSLEGVVDYLTDESMEIVEQEVNEHIAMITEICEFIEKYKDEKKDKEDDYI